MDISAPAKLQAIRDELPAVAGAAFFNTGSFGPIPRRAQAVLIEEAGRELERGRMGQEAFDRARERKAALRHAYARLLGAEDSEIALTHSTTEGINIALAGLDWQAGDRLITAGIEHPAVLNPAAVLHARRGVDVVTTGIGMPGVDALLALECALEAGAKAVVLSHVSFATGVVIPVRELSEAAHRAGAVMIVDGAQSVGMIPLDLHALGADAYAGPGQKWLCGPGGTGVLYVSGEALDRIQLAYAGYASGSAAADARSFDLSPGASRFEALSMHGPSVEASLAAMEWLAGPDVGWPWAMERISALGRRLHGALSRIPGVSLVAPVGDISGLVSFSVAGRAPGELTQQVRDAGFVIRDIPRPAVNRVSTGFYNTEEEIDRFARVVGAQIP